jgi:uncharacterized protein (TIGR00369 family)
MVNTSTLSSSQVEAMMARINAVPMMHTLDLEVLRLDQGECEAKVKRKKEWDGIYETFHGGMLGVIADSITCFAILTSIGAEENVATTDFNIRFLRPCNTDVVCVGRVIKTGRTLCVSEAEVTDMNGKVVAIAQVTYARL